MLTFEVQFTVKVRGARPADAVPTRVYGAFGKSKLTTVDRGERRHDPGQEVHDLAAHDLVEHGIFSVKRCVERGCIYVDKKQGGRFIHGG